MFLGDILDPHGEERRLRRVSNHEGRAASQSPSSFAAAEALLAGKPVPLHFNEFSSAKLRCRFYRICAFVP
ncbi:hypothetical protein [Bradyrhizobium sp. CCGB01]|uniref:hypothetical protein n=1 Tax=Bradyrhizobium sp. CCGB01 TaxID=2949634 RepID=UPI0020B43476|nr:hypothetical protein [Bradyrhizobium sp. CCGB01]MCP3410764.1 hypothetical protein [Bradyrhizobium sp. CCGB01]